MIRDWQNFFTAEDFENLCCPACENFPDIFNGILRGELEKAQTAYGFKGNGFDWNKVTWQSWATEGQDADTHTARLIDIKKIESKK